MNCYEAIDLMGDALESGVALASQDGFDEHLRECSPCRNYYEQIRLTRDALRTLPRTGPTAPNKDQLIDRFREENGGE